MGISISKEDYLKAIAEAESEGETVMASTLVRWLEVSAPAASMALKRLQRDRLIDIDDRKVIRLLPGGRQIAERLLRRHHLLERMLAEMFGLEWYQVHDEAERLEHAISDDFERKLRERLSESVACPHGNLLGRETHETRRAKGWLLLSESQPGQVVTFRSVYERDRSLLEYLDGLQLRPGAIFTVLARNWDDTLVLSVTGNEVVLGKRAAELIWVEPVPEDRSG